MASKLGKLIKQARVNKDLTRQEAANKLGITSGYLGHLERGAPVILSDWLLGTMITKLGVPRSAEVLQDRQNAKARAYYRNRRKKAA